ncbi:coiled-coil domain-containing protein [Ancylobacter terrae]|uniref:hypothetical protein n=1 Tax=Ancylobacter sp. sgz301288 TaxID=3342077 RepID=UPI00385D4890
MSLDVFQRDEQASLALARQHLAQDLPATFSESFDAAWRAGLEFGNSDAQARARIEGVQDFVDDVRKRTGVLLVNPALGGGVAALEQMNAQLVQLSVKHPDLGLHALTEEDIDRLGEGRSRDAREAAQRMAGREQTWGAVAGSLLGSVAAGGVDPVNLIAVPLAAPASLGILGTALATAGITAGTQAAIEAVTAGYKERVEPGYVDSGEAGQNVVGAAVAGGVLGGGAKALGALWSRVQTGAWPRSIRDAGNVVASEAQLADTNILPGVEGEVAHRTALQASIDALVSGRPVDVSDTITPSLLRGYEARLQPVLEARAKAIAAGESAAAIEREGARLPATVERLSEVQLADIRASARSVDTAAAGLREGFDAEDASLTAQRGALLDRTATIGALRDEVDSLRTDVERVEARIADARPPIDADTQARLDAIDADLAVENIPADRRAYLEGERASIAETLAATAPGDARLAASLEAEAKGLRRALARKEKALDRAAATEARARAKLDKTDAALPGRRKAAETRVAGQREALATEMRRAVSRLAQEGYSVRLPRDDAEAFAARILGAGDGEVDDALRALTETLVDRRLEALRSRPAAEPGIGKPAPIAEQEARRGYWIDEARKHIQALAREVGHNMPREDAGAVAAAIARAPDEDAAGAILDELLLRPRTMAATLPGTEAARLERPRAGGTTESPGGLQGDSHSSSPSRTGASIAGEPRPEQIAVLADELTPARIAAARSDAAVDDVVAHDLDKLRAMGDRQVPIGERLNERGELEADMRSVDELIDEADARLAAAREIAACALPQPEPA